MLACVRYNLKLASQAFPHQKFYYSQRKEIRDSPARYTMAEAAPALPDIRLHFFRSRLSGGVVHLLALRLALDHAGAVVALG